MVSYRFSDPSIGFLRPTSRSVRTWPKKSSPTSIRTGMAPLTSRILGSSGIKGDSPEKFIAKYYQCYMGMSENGVYPQ